MKGAWGLWVRGVEVTDTTVTSVPVSASATARADGSVNTSTVAVDSS